VFGANLFEAFMVPPNAAKRRTPERNSLITCFDHKRAWINLHFLGNKKRKPTGITAFNRDFWCIAKSSQTSDCASIKSNSKWFSPASGQFEKFFNPGTFI